VILEHAVLQVKPGTQAEFTDTYDRARAIIEAAEGFNSAAKSAAEWTLRELTLENRQWLAALPEGPKAVDDLIEICHGSPFDEDAYLFDRLDALEAIHAASRPLCLFGHTHFAVTFELRSGANAHVETLRDAVVELKDGSRYLVNPGSVGQPRDGDARAAYAIVDTATRRVELFRVAYPIERAQAKVLEAGLPEVLAARLAVGR